jgi:hypothetical protein
MRKKALKKVKITKITTKHTKSFGLNELKKSGISRLVSKLINFPLIYFILQINIFQTIINKQRPQYENN